MRKFIFWAALLILAMLIVPMYLEACPACKTLDDPIGKGFNWSVLFMMAMPFTVFTLIGGTIFLYYRKNAPKQPMNEETSSTKLTERS